MRVLLTVSVLAAAIAAAPVAATAAPRFVRPFAPPVVFHGGGGDRRAVWRHDDGDHEVWRHRRRDVVGGFVPFVGDAIEVGPETSPSPFVVAAPVSVNVTFMPGAGPAAIDPIPGPKIIEIGRGAPRRGPLPLVVYGD